jgi:hypothetical protein
LISHSPDSDSLDTSLFSLTEQEINPAEIENNKMNFRNDLIISGYSFRFSIFPGS